MILEGQFECLGESTEESKTFSAPIEKEVPNIDKDGNESVVTISYKIKLINSARCMTSSLPNLVYNLTEGIHNIKCKDCDYFLEYESVKDNLMKYKCLYCNKDYSKKLDEKFKKRFKCSSNDINKFTLLLRKCIYPYVYIGKWKKIMKHHYLKKKNFIAT